MCGAAVSTFRVSTFRVGLSPRVRGSRARRTDMHCSVRSIPACAGQPEKWLKVWKKERVYPRVCGAADVVVGFDIDLTGLSPRVRGSRMRRRRLARGIRSIPACAGQPMFCFFANPLPAVYPRVCGAAAATVGVTPRTVGLSPRVRGSP